MSLPWKTAAKVLRQQLGQARKRWLYWEGLAKGRPDQVAMRELEHVKLDAFTGWLSARILGGALRRALDHGVFDVPTRVALEKDLAKVKFEDPDAYVEH